MVVKFANGKVDRKSNYKQGLRHGVFTTYYRDGSIREKTEYKDDFPIGESVVYFDNGQIDTKRVYGDYGIELSRISYRRKDGSVKETWDFNDVESITYITYSPKGKVLKREKRDVICVSQFRMYRPETAMLQAITNMGFLCLPYGVKKGFKWINPDCAKAAVARGDYQALVFAVDHGAPLNADVAVEAATRDLIILKYLHEKGCPWDARTTTNAASSKQLHNLKYAIENGCPVTREAMTAAIAKGHHEIIAYLRTKGL